jgi:antitoxin component HigA of HigAB toxin-antitoxin module
MSFLNELNDYINSSIKNQEVMCELNPELKLQHNLAVQELKAIRKMIEDRIVLRNVEDGVESLKVLVGEYKMPVSVLAHHLSISRTAVYNLLNGRHEASKSLQLRISSFVEMIKMDL